MRRLVLLVVLTLSAPAAAQEPAVLAANVGTEANVAVLGSEVVWTEPRGERFALRRLVDGVATDVPRPPVRTSTLDLGLDARGRVVAALGRCPARRSCDLALVDVATGRRRLVPAPPTAHDPSLDGNRLAFLRGTDARGSAFVRDLRTRRVRRVLRQRGWSVGARLDLSSGGLLAMRSRSTDLDGFDNALILGGREFVRESDTIYHFPGAWWAGSRVLTALNEQQEGAIGASSTIYRYDPRSRGWERAKAPKDRFVTSIGSDGTRVVVTGCGLPEGAEEDAPPDHCDVLDLGSLAFVRSQRPL
jgi:hypothetical protein